MGLPNEVNSALIGAAAAGGYEIEQSLRFDGSGPSRLTYDNTSGTNNSSSAWTLSFWMKRGSDVVNSLYGNDLHLMMWTPSGSCANTEYFLIADPQHGTTSIQNCMSFNGGGYSGNAANKLRDCSAWYHFVWRGNTGSSTNIIYINGVPVTAYNQGPSSMTSQYVNGASRWSIGDSYTGCGSSPWDGYLAEVHFVDGQTLDHEDFGEFDDNGVWRPIKYTGTYGTNGYYLKFDPSATNGVGHDHSGNGHHWTASNVTTSGTGTDVFSDTPTNNFMVWNRNNKYHNDEHETREGNLRFETTTNLDSSEIRGTFATNTGKWYCEFTLNNSNTTSVGLVQSRFRNYTSWIGNGVNATKDAYSWGYDTGGGSTYHNGSTTSSYGSSLGSGDILMMAWDVDAGKIWWGKNGTWFSSGNPANGTNPAFTDSDISSGEYLDVACGHPGTNSSITLNAGQRALGYTPPSGFKTLCTANLPAPDIADGSQYFDILTWTGDSSGASRTFSGLAFGPDLVWAKGRNQSISHQLTDIVRGAGATSLRSDDARVEGADGTSSGYLSAFTSDGFQTTSSSTNVYYNTNGYTYVAWSWDAGGSGSSNTDGSITSTVSASPSSGFSIVSYTSQSSAPQTVGHGLGVKPSMILTKNRDGTDWWGVYHSAMGATKALFLNSNSDPATASNYWNNTEPTSSVFTVNTDGISHKVGTTNRYIAYCFAEVDGFSKFGSYNANGDYADGTFTYLGFKPAFVMLKVYTAAGNWQVYDNKRGPYNDNGPVLYPDLSQYEDDLNNSLDFLSNGFKVYGYGNDSPQDFLYMAFAENPFGGEGVSPATAR